jgi:acetylornithine/succinyldiaminopimelate/putrescine aminotransferase
VLGHITTFGGHPVCGAAGLAAGKVLLKEKIIDEVNSKAALFREMLQHKLIKAVRANGLLIAIEFENFDINKKVIDGCLQRGLLTDWFLFAPECMRIAPPLTITEKEIKKAVKTILEVMDGIH